MISLLSDILEILLLVLKSLFRVVRKKKHENRSQEQTEERPSGPSNTRAAGPPSLCEEQGSSTAPHKPRKRRKSITETVTRTITVESMGSSSTGSPSPDTDQKTGKISPKSD